MKKSRDFDPFPVLDFAPMPNESLSAYRVRITQIACGLALVGAFLASMSSLMSGSFGKAALVVAVLVGGSVVFALGDRYWLVLPFLAVSGLKLPRLPFNGTELGVLVVAGMYFFRLAIKKSRPFRFTRELALAVPVLFWMAVVWLMNPTGLSMFGSEMIGGRFYFDIAIGSIGLFVLSAIRVSESDARWLFWAILAAQLWLLVRGVVFPAADPDAIVFSGGVPERSTRYAFVVCSSIFMLLYARWPLSSILASPPKVAVFFLLALLTVYSGKRRAFGTVVLVPFFRMFLTGREKLLTVTVAFLGVILLFFAVAGDGGAYHLPQSARRVLAIVAPQYRRSSDDGGVKDLFREHMRRQARYVIADNPWFGRKGFAMSMEEIGWIQFGGGRTSLFASHAYSGNWHSAWFAYAADFGIPCAALWFLFALYALVYAFKACRVVVVGRYLPTCCLYYACWFFVDAAFSYTSGHSAITTMNNFVAFGTLLAIVRGYRLEQGLDAS